MIFFLPVFAIAFTNLGSSQEFIDERSIGSWPGKTALSCGHIFPLKDLVSTVVRTTGTSKIRVALARATVLLMIDWRSKLAVPNNICGWWSMNATAQLSGVSRPFSLRFICCVCAIYLILSVPKLLPPLSTFEVHTDASVVPILSSCVSRGGSRCESPRSMCDERDICPHLSRARSGRVSWHQQSLKPYSGFAMAGGKARKRGSREESAFPPYALHNKI